MHKLSTQDFKEKVFNFETSKTWDFKGNRPAIIDFYADWCGPCKRLTPILEEISKEYNGKVDVYKVDTDAETEVAQAFGIMSIPSILFIPVGSEPQMAVGGLPKETIEQAIKEVLKVEKSLIIT